MSERTQIETPEISRSKSTQRQLFNIDLIDEVRKVYSVFRAYELQEIKLNLSAFKGQCVRNINAFKLQGLYKRMQVQCCQLILQEIAVMGVKQ
ncbi:hypothetical protein SS50377_27343 [Spironucleus salmonicida]|nr:hypothetical protein SS50377_27343 [Spironucleus salmonicida]